MQVQYRYQGRSGILNRLNQARLGFATNTVRESVRFDGELAKPLVLREALAALHAVVVSDFKYRPRDRVAFLAWLDEQDRRFLLSLGVKSAKARDRIKQIEDRLRELDKRRMERLKPFETARLALFNYLYVREFDFRQLLDPVITVHPDEIAFEAFSKDESTYARVAAKFDLFEKVYANDCGTTNIDFSAKLHNEMERIRTYRRTRFTVDPDGFGVAVEGEDTHREKKIDLPDSWVNGFLQVHSTMSLGLTRVHLTPVDLYNICRYLRRHKTRTSPRALRYELTPGQKARAVLEPWNVEIELSGSWRYEGPKPVSFRTWGRDRLMNLGRLLPGCIKADVYLAGYGLPSIYVLDLGGIVFTMALSGWTDNDWTGGAKFDLLARRLTTTAAELSSVNEHLRTARRATDAELATGTGLGIEKCRSAVTHLCQTGRAMYDLAGGVYRHRDLFGKPLDVSAAVVAPVADTTPQEKAARAIFERGDARLTSRRPVPDGFKLTGSVKGTNGARVRPLLHVAHSGAIQSAECTCEFCRKHQLTRGPCEHILALRLAHMSRLATEDESLE
jgi:hypothetical protein